MKSAYQRLPGLLLAGCLVLLVTSNADAQRGRGGFRGGVHIGGGFGGPRVGLGFGFGGPRFSVGIGYRPYGTFLNALPYGYYPFVWGPDQYYYYDGRFYRLADTGYEITAPPIGAAVPDLPANASPITIDGQQYYERRGVYFKEGTDDKGKKVYIVAGKDGVLNTGAAGQPAVADHQAPKVGDVVDRLPDGCRKVSLNGKKYFVSADDMYYEEFTDANQHTGYRIASIPEEEPVKQ